MTRASEQLRAIFAAEPHAERQGWADTLPQEAHQTPAVDTEMLIALAQVARIADWISARFYLQLTAAQRGELLLTVLHRG